MGERARRWLRWGVLVLVPVVSVYYLLLAGEYDAFDVGELESARAAAIWRVDSLQAVVDSLSVRAASLVDDTLAIERLARERYGFIREGERLYRFVTSAERTGGEPADGGGVDPAAGQK